MKETFVIVDASDIIQTYEMCATPQAAWESFLGSRCCNAKPATIVLEYEKARELGFKAKVAVVLLKGSICVTDIL